MMHYLLLFGMDFLLYSTITLLIIYSLGMVWEKIITTIKNKCHSSKESLYQSQQMLHLVIDSIPQKIFWKNRQNIYLGCNQSFARILGFEHPGELLGKSEEELIDSAGIDPSFFQAIRHYIIADGQLEYQHTEKIELKDGSPLWLEMNKIPLRDTQGEVVGVLGCFDDITEHKCVEDKLGQAMTLLENSVDAICITDKNSYIITVNNAFTKITGYKEHEVVGKQPSILKSGRHDDFFYKQMWEDIKNTGRWEGEIWNRRKNGDIYPEWLNITAIRDQNTGEIKHYLAIFSDITTRKQTEQRLNYLAHYDDLTGLPNRTLLYERLNRAIYHAQQQRNLVAVLFLDLDRFKYVNDTWGHVVGDLLLKEVANRLTECLHKTDTLARLGGDEFTILLENINNSQEISVFTEHVLDIFRAPFNIHGHETFITPSIGVSIYPTDGNDAENLLKNADLAMYQAKESGKNNCQFFTRQMNLSSHKRLLLETKLRHALQRDELMLYYQPQMHLLSGRIIGVEVLLRWRDPDMGLISPQTFIPLAEETGLIIEIGEWVLRNTCLQHQRWRETGNAMLRMGINLSARQFRQDNLLKDIVRILEETAMDANLLELEITESLLMQDVNVAIKILSQLQEMGIQIAIDDFGTGYSSLSYLKRFPINKLKIDQSFVRGIPQDKEDMAIIRAINALARALRLQVIAEGVETKEQLAFFKSLKCDEVQGYLISRPLSEKEFTEYF